MIRWLTLLTLLLLPTLATGATYTVSQANGSDTNAGTATAPFATIQRCATVARPGDTCTVRAGIYRETVTPASDTVTFAAETPGSVTISGADLIGSWGPYQGSIYKSGAMTWTMGVGNDQVFVDGVMMNLARYPNATLDVSHPTWNMTESVSPSAEGNGDTNPWSFDDSTLTQANGFWVGAEVTTLAPHNWAQSGVVTDSSPGHITYTNLHPSQQRLDETRPGSNYEYYLSNVLGALDTAGEWFWDGSTTLYLWAPNGDNPSGHIVEAKRRQWAWDLSGRSNLTIRNINIFSASINMNSATSGVTIDGMTAQYVWHSTRMVPDPAIGQNDSKWGAWKRGIRMDGANNTIKNCTIAYSSHNGVYMHGTKQTVDNCTIHDVGYAKPEGGAVSWMGQDPGGGSPGCSDLTVKNSTMYNSGRHIVNSYYCPQFVITHNDMHHWGIDTIDNGCWYTSKGGTSGEISYNLCHDTEAKGYRFGIYMDATPENYLLHHNVVWNVSYGINIGEPSNAIQVYNNTVWFVDDGYGILTPGNLNNVKTYNNLVKSGIVGTDTQNNLETTSPKFVNADAKNFQLQSTSPAIDKGRVIPGITDGASGSAPDIGAYEYGTTPWTAGATAGGGTPPPSALLPAPKNLRLIKQ